MKILFIGYMHGYGGAEKQITMLANEMKEKKHEILFVSLACNNFRYELNSEIGNIYIKDSSNRIIRIFNRFIKLKKEIKKFKPDIIVNFWFQSAAFTALMNKKYTGKIIYSERGDPRR